MNKDFDEKEFRDAFVEEFLRTGVAFQIRALREGENWSQKQLGDKTGKPQNVISRLEDPDYGNYTIRTLLELASAFDVALLVRFASFGELWRVAQQVSPEAIAVPKYEAEHAGARSTIDLTNIIPLSVAQSGAADQQIANQAGANLVPSPAGLLPGPHVPIANTLPIPVPLISAQVH